MPVSTSTQPQMRQVATNPFADEAAKRQSGAAALGAGLMAMDDDSDDDEPAPVRAPASPRSPPPIAAPKPGYVSRPIDLARPEPTASPAGREPVALPSALQRTPSTEPHPLRAPMTPIQPVFARPKKVAEPAVNFTTPIMRGGSEDVLLPKRGEKGDDFWRRFSMVAHSTEKESQWLSKTQGGTARMSRWVWSTGLLLLLLIVAGIGFGVYYNHMHQSTEKGAPRTVGGQAGDHSGGGETTGGDAHVSASVSGAKVHTSSILFVSATNTVARRDAAAAHPTNVARMHAGLRSRQNRILDLD